ncbi:5-formyltetrahydrofolate cyclo-ligase [Psychrobium sp. 1_MG-2023]|uniref:5-formyltetrahydrofolate cyclo-ligase n=1 Tax=Psychrobium sp. 1_MG-2023 TaxID=3062624 RepID=UPI000C33A015|nr:5-formyltetrahydrofolate cyclo-ligase [Psychrobium sp. 1_MG-2023]MDP2562129.1 5-formyltetrahydrofolate cyclo-ligase [Psychrobium sp. 1_MG-2023]PKF57194.1 5-formyltetrahydrofolate cyclo-ligase [Alteromonadales bacterium alter-6D02]
MIHRDRQQLRQFIRIKRQQLSVIEQQQASEQLAAQLVSQLDSTVKQVAIYLANDGEIDPMPFIKMLWQCDIEVYLPVVHPFCPGYLLFLRYQVDSELINNKYGIPEPRLNVSTVCPVSELDVVYTPLVAFDHKGNRMGMGGGYYDRTLANHQNVITIGLAHDCQEVNQLPIERWDVPLNCIVTPNKIITATSNNMLQDEQ